VSDLVLNSDEKCTARALGRDLVHRYLNVAGDDWPGLDEMITSTVDLIGKRLLEVAIPLDLAASFSTAVLDEARTEAARARSAMTTGSRA
jgi:hypothetical protein